MKKLTLSLALLLVASFAFSMSDPNLAASAKALNLDEVVKNMTYPTATNAAGVEGTVIMYLEIDADGNVADNTALAYPCTQLKESVELALKDLKFEPAKDSDGNAIASKLRIPFEFELTID